MAHLPHNDWALYKKIFFFFSDWPFWHRIQCCICVSCHTEDNSYAFIHILPVSYEHFRIFSLFLYWSIVYFFFPRHAQLFSNLGEIIAKYSKAITKSMTRFAGFVGNFKPPTERKEFEGESRRNLRFFDEIKWFVRGSVCGEGERFCFLSITSKEIQNCEKNHTFWILNAVEEKMIRCLNLSSWAWEIEWKFYDIFLQDFFSCLV